MRLLCSFFKSLDSLDDVFVAVVQAFSVQVLLIIPSQMILSSSISEEPEREESNKKPTNDQI
jgi:hypothetical protein